MVLHLGPWSLRTGSWGMLRCFPEGIRRVDFHQRGSVMSHWGKTNTLHFKVDWNFSLALALFSHDLWGPPCTLAEVQIKGDRWLLTQTETAQLFNDLFRKRRGLALLARQQLFRALAFSFLGGFVLAKEAQEDWQEESEWIILQAGMLLNKKTCRRMECGSNIFHLEPCVNWMVKVLLLLFCLDFR